MRGGGYEARVFQRKTNLGGPIQMSVLNLDFQKYDRCGHVKPSLALILDVLLRVI